MSALMGTIKGAFSRKKEINALENALRQVDSGAGGDRDGMVDIDELRTVLSHVPNALKLLNVSLPSGSLVPCYPPYDEPVFASVGAAAC